LWIERLGNPSLSIHNHRGIQADARFAAYVPTDREARRAGQANAEKHASGTHMK